MTGPNRYLRFIAVYVLVKSNVIDTVRESLMGGQLL